MFNKDVIIILCILSQSVYLYIIFSFWYLMLSTKGHYSCLSPEMLQCIQGTSASASSCLPSSMNVEWTLSKCLLAPLCGTEFQGGRLRVSFCWESCRTHRKWKGSIGLLVRTAPQGGIGQWEKLTVWRSLESEPPCGITGEALTPTGTILVSFGGGVFVPTWIFEELACAQSLLVGV